MKTKSIFAAKKQYVFALLFGTIAIIISLRNNSIWIDEGITYNVVSQSFKDFLRSMLDISAGSAQCGMPLYIAIEWIWVHLFGTSELAMRSSNVIFILPFLIYAAKSLKKLNISPLYIALFALNSVFLYYINEARPYALLLSMGMSFFYYAMLSDLNDANTLNKMYICFYFGVTTHMMFLFIYFSYLMRCIFLAQSKKLEIRLQLRKILHFALPLLLVITYYFYVIMNANEVNNLDAVPLAGILQILYYFAGFSGLALNRNHLVDMSFSLLKTEHFILLGLLVIAYICMLIYILRESNKKKAPQILPLNQLIICFLVVLVLFFTGNILMKTRFWERHCIYLLPFVLILICILLDGMFHCPKLFYRVAAILMVFMQLFSSARIMLDSYYEKENYKGVAQWFENLEEDHPYTILYQGSEGVFEYYGWDGIPLSDHESCAPEVSSRKLQINNANLDDICDYINNNPDLYYLVLSEKNCFDRWGVYDLLDSDTTFQCFKIVRFSDGPHH